MASFTRFSLLPLLALIIALNLSPLDAKKFYFKFQNQKNSLQAENCSLNGVRTVHLPQSSQVPVDLNFRLHFSTLENNSSINLEAFDASDRRLERLELRFLHGHLQISYNGNLSPWTSLAPKLPQAHQNSHYLEVTNNFQKFKMNGRPVNVDIADADVRMPQYKIKFDETAQPDDDWTELLSDAEIVELLEDRLPVWSAPIKEVISLNDSNSIESKPENPVGEIDYIVYDNQYVSKFEVTSQKALPRIKLPKPSRISKPLNLLPFRFSFNRKPRQIESSLSVYSAIPAALASKTEKIRMLSTLAAIGFVAYLLVFLKLSKMSSIKPSLRKQASQQIQPQFQQPKVLPSLSSPSLERKLLKSSSSKVLSLDFPDAPLLKSTISTNGSVLKVAVPAALSLADNRHILFPSKLRHFQK